MKKQEFAVVRMNSTTGPYIVEKSSEDIRRSSIALIAYVTTSKKKGEKVARSLNEKKCPFCTGDLHVEWQECEKGGLNE